MFPKALQWHLYSVSLLFVYFYACVTFVRAIFFHSLVCCFACLLFQVSLAAEAVPSLFVACWVVHDDGGRCYWIPCGRWSKPIWNWGLQWLGYTNVYPTRWECKWEKEAILDKPNVGAASSDSVWPQGKIQISLATEGVPLRVDWGRASWSP